MIRILVTEDSPTMRQLLVSILESDPDIRVVGQAHDGAEAVELAKRLKPDLITMDVNMPVMDGLEATRKIMSQVPTPILIVSSSTSEREVEFSMNAMQAGALMVVAKPDNPRSSEFDSRRAEFVAMAKAMAQVKVVRRWASARTVEPAPRRLLPPGPPVRLVAIAASTGGPAALQQILTALPADFGVPILVVQHMAVGFLSGLADWLRGSSDLRVKLAEEGEPLCGGCVFLAPDARQLGVSVGARIRLSDDLPVNGFRPSGSYLFESASRAYGSSLLAVILTGMGSDGVQGLRMVKAEGGQVLAQDEATSIVYGMPREAVAAGVVDDVLALEEIAPRLAQLVTGGNHAVARPHS